MRCQLPWSRRPMWVRDTYGTRQLPFPRHWGCKRRNTGCPAATHERNKRLATSSVAAEVEAALRPVRNGKDHPELLANGLKICERWHDPAGKKRPHRESTDWKNPHIGKSAP